MTITKPMSSQRYAEFDQVFQLFDANGDGFISRQEIIDALEILGQGISLQDRSNLLNLLNTDDVVTRDAFMEWMVNRQDLDIRADLRQVFELIDVDGSGKLSIEEFTQIIRCFNTTVTDSEIAALVRKADLNGDGEIDFEEFIVTQTYESALKISIAGLRSFKKILLQYQKVAKFSSIALIEVDSELGAGTRGQSMGTAALREAAIQKQAARMHAENGVLSLDSLQVQTENWADALGHKHQYAKYIHKLYQVLSRTTDVVAQTLQEGLFPVVLGGDHSTAAGTIAGIKKAFPNHRLGVVWIDAHADIHSPYTTPSGNMHGMPLAMATATDNLAKQINDLDSDTVKLWNLCQRLGLADGANFSIEDLVYIAVRDTEEAEDHLIETHQILNMTSEHVRTLGADVVAQRCLEKLEGVDLIYVTFDVDSMDSTICMGTGTPAPNGIFVKEACLLNETLVKDPRVCCWEICEINPLLDTLNTMVENSLGIFETVVDAIANRLEVTGKA
ncbi:MAG: arginase [Moorea sp. SIOASIH]|uniref:arginase family protein n=1 Tax=Moorena sp. SIOASIH TaxID=2607817 RepID=UPI0013B9D4D8|nr:arginase family protein [Moorena sp. SIOASIH]NEO35278.1 arginase [Moorena sp. SIOASIH]